MKKEFKFTHNQDNGKSLYGMSTEHYSWIQLFGRELAKAIKDRPDCDQALIIETIVEEVMRK